MVAQWGSLITDGKRHLGRCVVQMERWVAEGPRTCSRWDPLDPGGAGLGAGHGGLAHLVFLLLELLLQVEFLSLQLIDVLPQFLGFLPARPEWGRGPEDNKDRPSSAFILTCPSP